ncbi:trimeric intracellular cation channel family protein [Streptococcus caprae]|uniref:Trimeric intracellular cation channel family protein n=1 Tax=Streptococcus caprae TaxID=1640501 RepID=A0ABV8CW79_9STRE
MDNAIWEVLGIVGTIAFALSGAAVAIEEDFDLLGIFTLGFLTAFGGGAIRNVMIDLPASTLWSQGLEFNCALVAILLMFFLPSLVNRHWRRVGVFTDAVGLAAFSIQGALHAQNLGQPLSAVIVAAVLTGAGGGIVRDVLAGRKPGVLRSEIYAGWSILAAVLIYFQVVNSNIDYLILVVLISALRIIGYRKNWQLPKVKWKVEETKND